MRSDKMKEAKVKAGRYCAYQERTQQEVRDKLYALELFRDEVEQVLTELITENYVNEERFAKSYASGKFRIKQWGKRKIIYALKQKNISSYCIEKALKEIEEDEYIATIKKLIDKKSSALAGDKFIINKKVSNYMIGKGFEAELVWSILNES